MALTLRHGVTSVERSSAHLISPKHYRSEIIKSQHSIIRVVNFPYIYFIGLSTIVTAIHLIRYLPNLKKKK